MIFDSWILEWYTINIPRTHYDIRKIQFYRIKWWFLCVCDIWWVALYVTWFVLEPVMAVDKPVHDPLYAGTQPTNTGRSPTLTQHNVTANSSGLLSWLTPTKMFTPIYKLKQRVKRKLTLSVLKSPTSHPHHSLILNVLLHAPCLTVNYVNYVNYVINRHAVKISIVEKIWSYLKTNFYQLIQARNFRVQPRNFSQMTIAMLALS